MQLREINFFKSEKVGTNKHDTHVKQQNLLAEKDELSLNITAQRENRS